MPKRYSDGYLRTIRNDVPIGNVIADLLNQPAKVRDGYFRFLCPLCNDFETATNPRTNLARCFRCGRNFNAIDFVMLVKRCNFREAVAELGEYV